MAIVKGYVHRNDKRSSDFRMLYALYYNSNSEESKRKSPEKLWPLSIDEKEIEISEEDMYERNKRLIEYFNKETK